jgi:putative membrane protein
MKIPPKVTVTIFLMAVAGLGLFLYLIIRHDMGDILATLANVGWGILLVFAAHALNRLFDTLSWRALIPKEHRPPLWRLLLIHWVGDSVSALLPVAQVGGEIIRVRMFSQCRGADGRQVPLPVAASSVLVGMTISLATQIIFLISGLIVLSVLVRHHGLTGPILLAVLVSMAMAGGFYAVQRAGMFRIAMKIIGHVAKGSSWSGLASTGEALDADIRASYARRGAVLECAWWNMATWGAGALEIWAALCALGIHGGYPASYALESVAQGIRSAMFLVPGAIGFQEGSYVAVGRLLGIASSAAMALALLRRVREVAFGVPGIVVWQIMTARGLRNREPAIVSPVTDNPA